VLEAVDELPLGGNPIPASAQKRVEQFLVKQISSGSPAVSCSGSLAAKSPCMRPKELQDTKQLREFLQKHVKTAWVSVTSTGLTHVVTAAVQLVAESAHRVARQQVIDKNSQAYTILLDEGYRAGVRPCL
jgi:acid stress-induced BolA-like protein IbaG/YrbA